MISRSPGSLGGTIVIFNDAVGIAISLFLLFILAGSAAGPAMGLGQAADPMGHAGDLQEGATVESGRVAEIEAISSASGQERDRLLDVSLHVSLKRGSSALAKALLEAGAKPVSRDFDGQSDLHAAISAKMEDTAFRLIESGADFLEISGCGESPLLMAKKWGLSKLFARLEELGSNCQVGPYGYSKDNDVFLEGVGFQNAVSMKFPARREIWDPEVAWYPSPLYLAWKSGHRKTAESLINAGADPALAWSRNPKAFSFHPVLQFSSSKFDWFEAGRPAGKGEPPRKSVLRPPSEDGMRPEDLGKALIDILSGRQHPDKRLVQGRTALWIAAYEGMDEVARVLLAHGSRVDAPDNLGRTPLFAAASEGHAGVVTVLFSSEANPNARDVLGNTALHFAAARGHQDICKVLVQKGGTIDPMTDKFITPLSMASGAGHDDLVVYFLGLGARPNPAGNSDSGVKRGQTLTERDPFSIFKALAEGNLGKISETLDHGASLYVRNGYSCPPLHEAIVKGDETLALGLIDLGADVFEETSRGITPYHLACYHGLNGVAERLKALGIDPAGPRKGYVASDDLLLQKLPPELAGEAGLDDILRTGVYHDFKGDTPEEMLKHSQNQKASASGGASTGRAPLAGPARPGRVKVPDSIGRDDPGTKVPAADGSNEDELLPKRRLRPKPASQTAKPVGEPKIITFAAAGDLAGVEAEIAKGTPLDAVDGWNATALHWAVINGHPEIAKLLVSKGAPLEARSHGWTPMHTAARYNRVDIGEILWAAGASLEAKGDRGWTPLHRAADHDSGSFVKFLVAKGVDLNPVSADQKTPLDIANSKKQLNSANLLAVFGGRPRYRKPDASLAIPVQFAIPQLPNPPKLPRKEMPFIKVPAIQRLMEMLEKNEASLRTLEERVGKGEAPLNVHPDTRDLQGRTLLFIAAATGRTDIAARMLRLGASPDARDIRGRTPLHAAARFGHATTARILIEAGASSETRDDFGWCPRQYCTMAKAYGYPGIEGVLEKPKVRTPPIRSEADPSLHFSRYLHLRRVVSRTHEFLSVPRTSSAGARSLPNPPNPAEILAAALSKAIERNLPDTVEALLGLGADPDKPPAGNPKLPPLSLAVHHGLETVANLLLKAGANPNVYTYDKDLMLIFKVLRKCRDSMLKLFLDAGVDLNPAGPSITSPLNCAVGSRREGAALAILDKGADFQQRGSLGYTPMHLARRHGLSKLIARLEGMGDSMESRPHLYRMGADPMLDGIETELATNLVLDNDFVTTFGFIKGLPNYRKDFEWYPSPLYCAWRGGQREIAAYLIDLGADPLQARGCNAPYPPIHPYFKWLGPPAIDFSGSETERSSGPDILPSLPLDQYHAGGKDKTVPPMVLAAQKGDWDLVARVLAAGADPGEVGPFGLSALHYAALAGKTDVCRELAMRRAKVDLPAENEVTPLALACLGGHLDTARFLVELGASIDPCAPPRGMWPIHVTRDRKDISVSRMALNENRRNSSGNEPAIFNFARSGSLEGVAWEIAAGTQPNLRGRDLDAPLHLAAASGDSVMTRFLLAWGADVDPLDPRGETPLFRAVREGHDDVVKVLLQAGSDCETAADNSFTPLGIARLYYRPKCRRLLLEHIRGKRSASSPGPVEKALEGYGGIFEKCMAQLKVSPVLRDRLPKLHDLRDPQGRTMLFIASFLGNVEMARWFLAAGDSARARDCVGRTPLHAAARSGNLDIIGLLLKNSAPVDEVDCFGWTPLHFSTLTGDMKTWSHLLDAGADPMAVTWSKSSCLSIAIEAGYPQMADLILRSTPPNREIDDKALLCAVGSGYSELVKALLLRGASPDASDQMDTALMIAVKSNDAGICESLLRAGADPTRKTRYREMFTVLDMVDKSKNTEIKELFQRFRPR